MEFRSVQKHVHMSPRKIREVADMVRNLTPAEALETLPYIRRRAAEPLNKVVNAAVASAIEGGISEDALKFKEIQIGEGPVMKRYRFASRGRVHGYKKRMSHIRVILEAEEKPKPKKTTKKTK